MADYLVVCEVPFFIWKAETKDDSISIAISEVGKILNSSKLENTDIEVSTLKCPKCGQEFESVLQIGSQALVGLKLTLKAFNADSPEHAKKIIKKKLSDVLLKKRSIEFLEVREVSAGSKKGVVRKEE